jgi:endoglucanase
MDTKDLIKNLSDSFGVTSFENCTFPLIEQFLLEINQDIKLEKIGIGNLVATYGQGNPKIAFFAHVDEIGIVISNIIDDTFARIEAVGGVDPRTLVGKRVCFRTENGEKLGVIGFLAPHLQKPEDKDKSPSFDELFVDFSVSGGTKDINVGDIGVINVEAKDLENDQIVGKAIDNRAGVAVLIKSFEYLQNLKFDGQLMLSFNKGEEVGLVGAKGAAEYLQPDYAVVVDVTFGERLPENVESFKIGEGPVISIGAPINKSVYDDLVKTAKDNNIKYQIEAVPSRSGTETDIVQIVGQGIKTGLVSVPILNMHSPSEVVNINDIDRAAKLLAMFALNMSLKTKGSLNV